MKKILCFVLILSFLSVGLFAEETEVVIEKYNTEQKVAIGVWVTILSFMVAIVAKEVIVDGAYRK